MCEVEAGEVEAGEVDAGEVDAGDVAGDIVGDVATDAVDRLEDVEADVTKEEDMIMIRMRVSVCGMYVRKSE